MRAAATAALALMLSFAPLGAQAEENEPLRGLDDTLQDMLEKMGPLLEQMRREMEPALDDARRLFDSLNAIDDPRHYSAPEILPNGDIILRRRPDAPEYQPDADPDPDAPQRQDGSDAPIKT